MQFLRGGPEAREKAEQSLDLAERLGREEDVLRVLANLAWAATRHRAHALTDRYLKAGLEYAAHPDHDLWRLYLLGYRARSELHRGRWDDAVATAKLVLRDRRTSPLPAILALVVIGLVRARRGERDPWSPLDEAAALARPSGELQRIEPVAGARAEAVWLEGRQDAVVDATEDALELARRRGVVRVVDELACWRRRAGATEEVPVGGDAPYALELAGDSMRAAERWTALGCPYEAALAKAEAGEDEPLRAALEDLQGMRAKAAAAIVTRRLRERGARDLPRGPRAATRDNPANLTAREVEVLGLVAQGLRNRDIAERLFLSEKTVGHHVSAILRKLDLDTRGQASAEAMRLGLVRPT